MYPVHSYQKQICYKVQLDEQADLHIYIRRKSFSESWTGEYLSESGKIFHGTLFLTYLVFFDRDQLAR